jgi:hypothetical protein
MNLMGGAGMFAVSLYMIFMGKHYDTLVAGKLPAGADLQTYTQAPAGSDLANALFEAKKAAGPAIINFTLMIPLVLIIAFAGLNLYMRGRKKPEILATASAGH